MTKNKLFLQIWLITTAVATLSAVIYYSATSYQYKVDVQSSVRTRLLTQIPLATYFGHQLLSEQAGQQLQYKELSKDRLTVIDHDGVVIFDSNYAPGMMENHATRPEILQAAARGRSTTTRFSNTLKVEFVYVAQRLDDAQGNTLGFVRLATPLEQVTNQVAALREKLLIVIAFTVLVLLTVSYALTMRVYHPIARAARMAREIAGGNYETRLPGLGSDDTSMLERSLNDLSRKTGERVHSLEDSRNQLAGILSALKEGVIALDRQQRILHINEAAQAFIGVGSRALGSRIWEVVQVPGILELVDEIAEPGQEKLRTLSVGRKTIEVSVDNLSRSKAMDCSMIIVLHDVTRQHQVEKMRVDFVANASHELKTPLTVIRAMVETILDDHSMEVDTRNSFVERIGFQADRLQKIVGELLQLSRFDRDYGPANEFPETDFAETIKGVVDANKDAAAEKQIQLGLELEGDHFIVLGDPEALIQMANNLIDNAIKYSGPGSNISVKVSADAGSVKLSVGDEGPGIPAEFHERIFERFYRVDPARSRELGGTGLGLSIVKNIVASHGGSISLDSTPGVGSSFLVELPQIKAD